MSCFYKQWLLTLRTTRESNGVLILPVCTDLRTSLHYFLSVSLGVIALHERLDSYKTPKGIKGQSNVCVCLCLCVCVYMHLCVCVCVFLLESVVCLVADVCCAL